MREPPLLEWINAATGWGWSRDDMLEAGHRIQVLRHAFNLREGLPSDGFELPPRAVGRPPLDDGPLQGVTLDMDAMKQDYFDSMGYDRDGRPTRGLLESLGLHDAAGELEEMD
jgi:aldehyde:ferredoxin oxidoreductase